MALCLFSEDDFEEVVAKVTGTLNRWVLGRLVSGAELGGITQARERLDALCGPRCSSGPVVRWQIGGRRSVAVRLAAARHRRIRSRLTRHPANGAEFGYAGSSPNRSAFPHARVVALAKCGTDAFEYYGFLHLSVVSR
jgi:hypothetical protein